MVCARGRSLVEHERAVRQVAVVRRLAAAISRNLAGILALPVCRPGIGSLCPTTAMVVAAGPGWIAFFIDERHVPNDDDENDGSKRHLVAIHRPALGAVGRCGPVWRIGQAQGLVDDRLGAIGCLGDCHLRSPCGVASGWKLPRGHLGCCRWCRLRGSGPQPADAARSRFDMDCDGLSFHHRDIPCTLCCLLAAMAHLSADSSINSLWGGTNGLAICSLCAGSSFYQRT